METKAIYSIDESEAKQITITFEELAGKNTPDPILELLNNQLNHRPAQPKSLTEQLAGVFPDMPEDILQACFLSQLNITETPNELSNRQLNAQPSDTPIQSDGAAVNI